MNDFEQGDENLEKWPLWLLEVELHPPKSHMSNPKPLVPRNVALFGDRVLTELIKLKQGY